MQAYHANLRIRRRQLIDNLFHRLRPYTLNNIHVGYLEGAAEYNYHATPG